MQNKILHFFDEISAIPRGSGNTKGITEYLINFAKQRNLPFVSDEIGNVIITKQGDLSKQSVVLQSHTDMVCVKKSTCSHDFLHDGIKLVYNGDTLSADGTSLGGDDGFGVAATLSLLDGDYENMPTIEGVFTVDEEIGMYGAKAIDASKIKSRLLLNLDNDFEGNFTVGCAGGTYIECQKKFSTVKPTDKLYKFIISGLLGGHSADAINLHRQNANVLTANFVKMLNGAHLASIDGGERDNVIANKSEFFCYTSADVEKAKREFLKEYTLSTDSGLCLEYFPVADNLTALSSDDTLKLCDFISNLPNGVIKYISGKDAPETSVNLGILKLEKGIMKFTALARSQINSELEIFINNYKKQIDGFGAKIVSEGSYSAWEKKENSEFLSLATRVYKNINNGKSPNVNVCHGGLECGIFNSKKDFDCISIGPDIKDIHSYNEHISIESMNRVYEFIVNLLKMLVCQ